MKPAGEAWPPMLRNALTAIAVTLAVSGCAVGPDYVTPPVAVPFKWSLADRSQSVTAPVLAHRWMAQERIRLGKLSASVDSYRQAATLSRALYRNGSASFFTVLDAERSLYSAEDGLVQSRIALAIHYVALNKALGGGWDGFVDVSKPELIDASMGPRPMSAHLTPLVRWE